jgi:putative transposase
VAGEVWQRGFSEVRVLDQPGLAAHRQYIAQNPVKAGLAKGPEEFPFSYRYVAQKKAEEKRRDALTREAQGLKPVL